MEISNKWIMKNCRMAKLNNQNVDLSLVMSTSTFYDSNITFEELIEIENGKNSIPFTIFHDVLGKIICYPYITTRKNI